MSNRRYRHTRGVRRLIAIGAGAALGFGALLTGPTFADQFPIDLADGVDARYDGAWTGDQSGSALGAAGDVNFDGFPDMIIGAAGADWYDRADSGAAYVVFGSATPAGADLGTPGKAAITILGGTSNDYAGWSVAGAGDFNHDKYADVIVGAPYDGRATDLDQGVTYVVFGSGAPVDVDLASLGSQGIRIEGIAAGDQSGMSVSGAGDVNADGVPDIIIGAPVADGLSRADSGSAFVVFGSDMPTDVDLAALSGKGFRIDGAAASDRAGASVAAAGDVNEDGYADVLVGAPLVDGKGVSEGAAYVVFGSEKPADVDLASLGDGGIRILGASAYDQSGAAVAGTGDVNVDGYADVIIGAPGADGQSRQDSGSAFVVFGSDETSDIALAALGDHGFRIDGAVASDMTGVSLAGPGDINADGTPDLLIGAYGADNNGRNASGSSYVVYGKTGTAEIDLATIGTHGFRIDGAAALDLSGRAVAGPGDVNADGTPDLLIGALGADNNGRSGSGSTYLLLESPPIVSAPGAPTGLTGAPGNGEVQLAWTSPADGGTPITGYRIDMRTAGGPWTSLTTGTDTTYTVTDLTNGTAHEFRIAATNAVGTGPDSDVAGPYVPRTVPGAPTGLSGLPGNGEVQLTWTAPGDGGSPITGYTATAAPGGASCATAGTGCSLTGLTNGADYTVTVTASNVVGTGPASAPIVVRPVAPSLGTQSATKPPKKVKKGKKVTLAKQTRQGAKVTWKTSSKKVCTVKKTTLTAKKKGKCKVSAKAPEVTGFTAFRAKFTIRVR